MKDLDLVVDDTGPAPQIGTSGIFDWLFGRKKRNTQEAEAPPNIAPPVRNEVSARDKLEEFIRGATKSRYERLFLKDDDDDLLDRTVAVTIGRADLIAFAKENKVSFDYRTKENCWTDPAQLWHELCQEVLELKVKEAPNAMFDAKKRSLFPNFAGVEQVQLYLVKMPNDKEPYSETKADFLKVMFGETKELYSREDATPSELYPDYLDRILVPYYNQRALSRPV